MFVVADGWRVVFTTGVVSGELEEEEEEVGAVE